ncbi:MauE/DoxX family redox-associated membrane protein [Streptomyces sp. NPDC052496]|uniref:MauE/DoxX family redox-associated membrane protein n=1 Tax=Streptomyces sp. NPDC052496 TaxID=3154951 RepID=UPI003432C726
MPYVHLAMRFLIGTVFLLAVVGKGRSRQAFAAFAASTAVLTVLPAAMTRFAAVAVVLGECLVCLLLLLPSPDAAALGFTWAAVLLVVFAAAIGRGVVSGTRTACRCFGASDTPLGVRHLVRNLTLAGLAMVGAVSAYATGSVHPAGLAVAAAGGLLSGGLVAALDTLADLFQPVRART